MVSSTIEKPDNPREDATAAKLELNKPVKSFLKKKELYVIGLFFISRPDPEVILSSSFRPEAESSFLSLG